MKDFHLRFEIFKTLWRVQVGAQFFSSLASQITCSNSITFVLTCSIMSVFELGRLFDECFTSVAERNETLNFENYQGDLVVISPTSTPKTKVPIS